MSKEFEIAREFEVDAAPEEVWDAITGGTGGWLWPMEFEPRQGGAGPFGSTLTNWDPPHRLTSLVEDVEGISQQTLNQIDETIEPRDGGRRSWMRYVHSGIFVEDWDNQYDGASKHTDFYLHTLREYLTHFAGRPVAFSTFDGPGASMASDAFATVGRALGLADDTAGGARVRAQAPTARSSTPWSTTATRTSSGCAPTAPSSASSGATTGARRSASASTTSRPTPTPSGTRPLGRAG